MLLNGCGDGAPEDTPEVGTVTGTVTLDGKPLPGVVVAFQPETGRGSTGRTDEQGKYTLGYNAELDGAAVGMHKVTITTPTEAPDPTGSFKEPIPAKYNAKTELTEQVNAGENVIDFDLKSN